MHFRTRALGQRFRSRKPRRVARLRIQNPRTRHARVIVRQSTPALREPRSRTRKCLSPGGRGARPQTLTRMACNGRVDSTCALVPLHGRGASTGTKRDRTATNISPEVLGWRLHRRPVQRRALSMCEASFHSLRRTACNVPRLGRGVERCHARRPAHVDLEHSLG